MTGYVAVGNDGFVDDRPIVSKEKKDSGPGFFKRVGRAISPTTSRGRRNLASRSSTGDVSPIPSIYDIQDEKAFNKSEFETAERVADQAKYAEAEAKSMKKAKEMYAEEVKNAKEKEKAEKKRKSKCNSELKYGCMLNCNRPTGNKKDCTNCVNRYFDKIPTGKTKCKENEISHYLDSHIMGLREDRIIGKATEEQAPRQSDKGYKMGTYSDDEIKVDPYLSNKRMTKGSAHSIRSRLGDREGVDYFGNLSPRKLKGAEPSAPPLSSFAMGGARRRRRTKRRKPKKSKKSKRTRRTRRQRR